MGVPPGFVPECNHAKESYTCQFFPAIFAGPRFVDITTSENEEMIVGVNAIYATA